MRRANTQLAAFAGLALGLVIVVAFVLVSLSGGEAQGDIWSLQSESSEALPSALGDSPGQTSRAPVPSFVTVCVLDETDAPIPAAHVSLSLDRGPTSTGVTDKNGAWVLKWPSEAGSLQVKVWKAGYSDAVQQVSSGDSVIVVLRENGVISGAIEWHSKPEVPIKCTVIAWPAGLAPSEEEFVRAASGGGHSEIRTALVDTDDGGFRLRGLDDGQDYRIVVVGSGVCSARSERGRTVPVGTADVRLSMEWWYGVAVTLKEDAGQTLRVPEGLQWEVTLSKSFKSSTLFAPPPWSGLIGLDADVLAEGDVSSSVYLYSVPERVDRLGPIDLSARLPGYSPLSMETWALPISAGIRNEVLLLHRTAAGFGTLQLVFEGTSSFSGLPPIFPPPKLTLRSGSEAFDLAVSVQNENLAMESVPWGDYSVGFVCFGEPVLKEPVQVSIGAQPARVHIDLAGLASAELVLDDALSVRYPLRVECTRELRPGLVASKSFVFGGKPVIVPALLPAKYRFVVPDLSLSSAEYYLVAGECTPVSLSARN